MAKSKGKIELQIEIKTQEQWDELLSKEGLIVVDTYSAWCGPCKAIVSSFKRLKNELGDDLLLFATAETDSIDSLDAYKMKSQPTFLFYAGGVLVNVIRGCKCPLLIKTIRMELEQEHKVLNGNVERVAFVDQEALKETLLEETKDEERTEENENEEEEIAQRMARAYSKKAREAEQGVEVPKQLTVAIIKPDAVKAGLVDEIIQKVQESGMEICHKEEKWFSKEEAEEFYKQHKGSDHFDQLVEFMSSGPCMTLVLSKGDEEDDAISYFRELIGPTDVKKAKEQAPTRDAVLGNCPCLFGPQTCQLVQKMSQNEITDRNVKVIDRALATTQDLGLRREVHIAYDKSGLRALYGTDTVMNAVHGCDSSESAARELAFFYPDFVVPTKKRKKRRLQRTLALIRPDALRTRRESILAKIEEAGFSIAMSKEITLTRDQAESFYSEHKNTEIFETLVTNMTSGPMMALCLAREDAVAGWRELLGPKDITEAAEQGPESLRLQFHVEGSPINPLHGSASADAAEHEIQQFFPMQSTVAVIKPDIESSKRGDIIQRIKEAGFKIQYEKEVTMDKELASQFYSEHKGKDFYEGLTDYMSSGPTLFMVLTREDAVSGWRALMGPTDPQEAVDRAPKSLRAQFGFDKMKNAVHGSSNLESAGSVIKDFFPELDILQDGSVKVSGEQERDEEKPHIEPRQEIYSEALGMESGAIPDSSITASSELDDQHSASKARLNTNPEGEQLEAWVPLETDTNQWLQVDLGKVTRITKIASQGEAGDSVRHVKQFILSYNLTGGNQEFVPYCEDSGVKVFEGNSDQTTVVYNELRYPVLAKFVRLNPKAWSEGIALRTELFGHDAETYSEPLGMENRIIPDYAIKASSVLDDQHSASEGRLNSKSEQLKEAWIPLESDENQWLQVDLGDVAVVTKVATQGGGSSGHYVSSYIMSFSQDGENFQPYEENGETKVLQGNSDESSVATQWFTKPVHARFCRLQPKMWDEQIALRMELYGRPPVNREAKGDVPSLQREKEDDIIETTQHDEEQSDGESNLVVKPDEQAASHEPDKTGEVLGEPAVNLDDRPDAAGESKAEEIGQETVKEGVNEEHHTAEEENLSSALKSEDQEAEHSDKPGNIRDEKSTTSEVNGDEENKLTEANGDKESKVTETSEDEGSRPTKANEDEDLKPTDGDEENKPTEVPNEENQSTPSSEESGGKTAEGSEGREAENVKNTADSQSDETKPTAEE